MMSVCCRLGSKMEPICTHGTYSVGLWSLLKSSNPDSNPDSNPSLFFLESESGFMYFWSESESSSKSLESRFGFAHHCPPTAHKNILAMVVHNYNIYCRQRTVHRDLGWQVSTVHRTVSTMMVCPQGLVHTSFVIGSVHCRLLSTEKVSIMTVDTFSVDSIFSLLW